MSTPSPPPNGEKKIILTCTKIPLPISTCKNIHAITMPQLCNVELHDVLLAYLQVPELVVFGPQHLQPLSHELLAFIYNHIKELGYAKIVLAIDAISLVF
jgi:hypothetical protein